MTRDELHREIAEMLGHDTCLRCGHRVAQHENRRQCDHCDCPRYVLSIPPNYSTSEDASAESAAADRKTAVLLAAQRWLGIEGALDGLS